MSHDYKTRSKSTPEPKKPYGWIWFAVGLITGVFLIGLAWLKLGTTEPEKRWIGSTPDNPPQVLPKKKPLTTPNDQTEANAKKPITKPETAKPVKPEFEFFETLPKQQVTVTGKPLELRETLKEKPENTIYYLQIASYNKMQGAERLRAELGFLGLETHISQAKLNGTVRYRVMSGPYTDSDTLTIARKDLQQQGYQQLLVVEKQ